MEEAEQKEKEDLLIPHSTLAAQEKEEAPWAAGPAREASLRRRAAEHRLQSRSVKGAEQREHSEQK